MPLRLSTMLHLPHDAAGTVFGFIGAGLSAGMLQLAQTLPPDLKGWLEGGAYLGLVGCLIYAVVTLWRRLRERDKEHADLQKEIRDDWKEQNRRLIDVLNKLDPDT